MPLDFTPRSFASPSSVPSGHRGAGQRHRHDLPAGHVRRAADDRARLARAVVDLADAQPVGVRVALGLQHPPDDEPLRGAHAHVLDPLHLGTGHVQALGQVRARTAPASRRR